MELFDSEIPIFSNIPNQEELDDLKKKFSQYDAGYVVSACFRERRDVLQKAYEKTKKYLDKDFKDQIKIPNNFINRIWELCVCSTLLYKGYNLCEAPLAKKSKSRPDFCILNKNSSKIWIEAVCPGEGAICNPNKVEPKPEMLPGVMYSSTGSIEASHKPRILRLLNSIKSKLDKREKYIRVGDFEDSDKYIIAVNTHKISHNCVSEDIEKWLLYGMGLIQLNFTTGESSRQFRPVIKNNPEDENEQGIEVAIFLRPEYKNISAVMFFDGWFDFDKEWEDALSSRFRTYLNHDSNLSIDSNEILFGEKFIAQLDKEFLEVIKIT